MQITSSLFVFALILVTSSSNSLQTDIWHKTSKLSFIHHLNFIPSSSASVYRQKVCNRMSTLPFVNGQKRKRTRDLTLDELKNQLNNLKEPYLVNSTRAQLAALLNLAKDPRRKRLNDADAAPNISIKHPPAVMIAASAEFEGYYRQQLGLSDSEMKQLLEYMATPLPISFRINSRCSPLSADQFDSKLRAIISGCSTEPDGPSSAAAAAAGPQLSRLPWYPGGAAWELRAGRTALRGALQPLQAFLVDAASDGVITRQEAVLRLRLLTPPLPPSPSAARSDSPRRVQPRGPLPSPALTCAAAGRGR